MTAFNSAKNNAQYITKQQTAFGVTSGNWLNFLDALGVQENSGTKKAKKQKRGQARIKDTN